MNCRLPNRIGGSGGGVIVLPEKGKALNDYTWEEISLISTMGMASEYFSVGDRKEIKLNGTISSTGGHAPLSFSDYTTYAFIIGINHNASIEGENLIHFQLGKTALSGGVAVAYRAENYNVQITNKGNFYMNSTTAGGWRDSNIRNNIYGTSITNYSDKFMGMLPEELRTVLKPVIKYTDNTGSSTGESDVTATTDYLFSLSEFEVTGVRDYANQYEQNKQKQYAYYSTNSSEAKYQHTSSMASAADYASWWLRSPRAGNADQFLYCYNLRWVSIQSCTTSLAIAPAFCV